MTNWKTELVLPAPRIAVDHIGSGPEVQPKGVEIEKGRCSLPG